jgi:hypothetical protein
LFNSGILSSKVSPNGTICVIIKQTVIKQGKFFSGLNFLIVVEPASFLWMFEGYLRSLKDHWNYQILDVIAENPPLNTLIQSKRVSSSNKSFTFTPAKHVVFVITRVAEQVFR